MKKIYALISFMLLSGIILAQVQPVNGSLRFVDNPKNAKIVLKKGNHDRSNSRWYNYGETMDLVLGGNISKLYGNNLFPDSTILVNYSTGYGGTWIHKLGEVFDPTCFEFNNPTNYAGELGINKGSVYKIDSIEMYCYYMRNLSNTIVDTLIFELCPLTVSTSSILYFGPTSAVSINLGTDSTKFLNIPYTYLTNSMNMAAKVTYKVPLTAATAADTTDEGMSIIKLAPNTLPNLNPNQVLVAAYTFKPGYTWIPNMDTLTSKNRFFFLSFKENPNNFPSYTKRDWNVSYIVPQDVRYNDAGSWNGRFIPSFAYMGSGPTYNYEHHLIYYKATGISNYGYVGQNELPDSKATLGNAYPNPVTLSEELVIPVSLTNANDARIVIRDIVGKTAMVITDLNNGTQNVIVNTSNLKPGVYFYSLEQGTQKVTKKITIVR